MSHEALLELAVGYALGVLDPEERSRFEAHLAKGCRECEAALLEYGETLASLATELPSATPPPRVRAALLARIDAEARPVRAAEGSRPRWAVWQLTLAGALAVAAVGVVVLGWRLSALERELTRRSEEVAALRTQVAQQQALVALLRAPDTRVVSLAGQPPSPSAQGRIWWNRDAGGFFVASDLPAAPGGKTYQLWAIAGGKPVSAGTFDVDPRGSTTLSVKPLPSVGSVEMFAVTLEPAGGLPQPTGQMYLAGKVL